MSHYIHNLYSKSQNCYCIGCSADVDNRLLRYKAGATPSTKAGRPGKVVFEKEFHLKTEALKYENYLNRIKSRPFKKTLIEKYNRNTERPG